MNYITYINKIIFTLNNSKFFAGIMMIILNLGSRFIVNELSETQEQLISNKIIRRFIVFTVVFVATKDILISLIVTAVFIVLVSGLFNENSKFCVLSKPKIKEVSFDDYKHAQKIIKLYELQKKIKTKK